VLHAVSNQRKLDLNRVLPRWPPYLLWLGASACAFDRIAHHSTALIADTFPPTHYEVLDLRTQSNPSFEPENFNPFSPIGHRTCDPQCSTLQTECPLFALKATESVHLA
jgi:hypothetical protein